jgi:hypothetical protein
MPATGSPASCAPDKELPGTRRCLFPLRGEGSEGLSPLCGGKLAREGFSPSQEKVAYQRRLVTCPAGQGLRARGKRILLGSSCHPPGGVHGRRTAEALCGRLAEGIITVPEAVMTDWTGRSSPIGAARQTGRKDSLKPSPLGLRHRSEPCDIYHTCVLATMVSH